MIPSQIRWLHFAFAALAAVMLQVSVFDRFQPFDVGRVDLPLMLVVGVGFVARAGDAAILGFLTGLFVDTMQFGPFGLSALVYSLAAWLIVLARLRMLAPGTPFRTVQGALIVVLVTAATWGAGAVFGLRAEPLDAESLTRLAVAGSVGAFLVHPLTSVAQWMIDEDRPTPLSVGGLS